MKWLLPLLLAGCVQLPTPSPEPSPQSPAEVVHETPLPVGALEDLLIAEIALARGDSLTAYPRISEQARATGDVALALRAARIATQLDPETALEAAQFLAEVSDSFESLALLARAYLLNDQIEAGLDALIQAAQLQPDQVLGFLPRLLRGSPDWAAELAGRLAQLEPTELALTIPWLYATETAEGPQQALAIALDIIERYPQRMSLYAEAARLAQLSDDVDQSIAILTRGIQREPNNQSLLLTRTQLQVADERYTDAIAGFAQLHALDPQEFSYQISQGMLAVEIEDWDLAESIGNTLSADPASESDGRLILGLVARHQGRLDEARTLLALEQGERFILARAQLAEAYVETQQYDVLSDWMNEGRALRPDQASTLYLTEAELYAEAEQNARIIPLLDQAIAELPQQFALYYARALYRDHEAFDLIVADLQAALEIDPDNASGLNALGYTYADAGVQLDEALDLISRALSQRPDDSAILDSMGWVQFRLGNIEQALSWLERAYERFPEAEIGAHLGEVLFQDGQIERARQILVESMELDSENRVLLETIERLQVTLP